MSLNIESPTVNDLDERIQLNLTKDKLTLEDIKKDTQRLVKEFEWTVARCTLQVRIYKDLLERVEELITQRDKDKHG